MGRRERTPLGSASASVAVKADSGSSWSSMMCSERVRCILARGRLGREFLTPDAPVTPATDADPRPDSTSSAVGDLAPIALTAESGRSKPSDWLLLGAGYTKSRQHGGLGGLITLTDDVMMLTGVGRKELMSGDDRIEVTGMTRRSRVRCEGHIYGTKLESFSSHCAET